MIAWESQLRPKEMAQVASYIMIFAGTTPANPKEPQGELYNTGGDAPVGSEVAPAEGETESDNATDAADSQTAEKKP
jgi:cytochrome c oxidase cbb3-type subunit 3